MNGAIGYISRCKQLSNDSHRIKSSLTREGLSALTRRRLEQQMKALDDHRNKLRRILEPVDIQSFANQLRILYCAPNATCRAIRASRLTTPIFIATGPGATLRIPRAWHEVKAISDDDKSLGKTLVLGAGSCRLAYDIHMQLDTELCVAMDFNPLLLLIAKSVMEATTPELYEFPISPKSIDDFAVLRKLSAPETAKDDFKLVLGDVLRPPFGSAAFDTVVTPWIIDIVNEDLPVQAARINRLLKAGGRWINFGSLAFDHPDRARCYSTEETLEIIERTGFSKPAFREASIPYMCSPASRHGRQETVLTFAATKTEDVKPPSRHKALPDWIVTGKDPVPALQSFRSQAVSTQIHSFIMSLIDGKKNHRRYFRRS